MERAALVLEGTDADKTSRSVVPETVRTGSSIFFGRLRQSLS